MTDVPDLRYLSGAQLDELMQAKRAELAALYDATLQTLHHETLGRVREEGQRIIAEAEERAREIIADADARAAAIIQGVAP